MLLLQDQDDDLESGQKLTVYPTVVIVGDVGAVPVL